MIGLMGSGKTTIGRLLAARLRVPFMDLDQQIEQRSGKSIPRIFAEEGEAAFRRQEAEMLRQLLQQDDARVLSTGGGVVLDPDNCRRLKKAGPVIWLDASPEILAQRIAGDANRPLLQNTNALKKIRQLDRQRRKLYRSCADFRVDTGKLSAEKAVAAIIDFLSESADD